MSALAALSFTAIGGEETYELYERSDYIILCKDCGGMMGDPYAGIYANKDTLRTISYGGSSWRWERNTTFVYDEEAGEWMLLEECHINFHAGDPENTYNKEVLTPKELGYITFRDFDYRER